MIARFTFLLIAAFWVTMNVLLWRAEYDSAGVGVPVPTALVWQKILTAPDISSLNVFYGKDRIGFFEFSTSVEQEMAALDEHDPVPKNVNAHRGYQIRFNGNVSVGDFTNRLIFSGQIEFSHERVWREMNLKLSSHFGAVEVRSVAAEQNVHLKISSNGGTIERVLRFDQLQDPTALWSALTGNIGPWATDMDFFADSNMPSMSMQKIQWQAHRNRLSLGNQPVPIYRLETRVFDRPIVIYVSTLGEILRVELPGGVVAVFDQLAAP